jgi:hypothetical protein
MKYTVKEYSPVESLDMLKTGIIPEGAQLSINTVDIEDDEFIKDKKRIVLLSDIIRSQELKEEYFKDGVISPDVLLNNNAKTILKNSDIQDNLIDTMFENVHREQELGANIYFKIFTVQEK